MTALDSEIEGMFEMPAPRVAPGDHVCVSGLPYRVWRVGEQGAALLSEPAWKRLQGGGLPPGMREVVCVRMNEMIVTGPARRLRDHVTWETHTTCL
jgi:hypothetical protein